MTLHFETPFEIGDKVIIKTKGSFIQAEIFQFRYDGNTEVGLKLSCFVRWYDVNEKFHCEIVKMESIYKDAESAWEAVENEHFDIVTEKEATI